MRTDERWPPRVRALIWLVVCVACGLIWFAVFRALAVAAEYQPATLVLVFADGTEEPVAATSPRVCEAAMLSVRTQKWRPLERAAAHGPVIDVRCGPGNRFAACSETIVGFNAPASCGGRR
jgi:hypothetical protein